MVNTNDRQRILESIAPLVSMFPHWKPDDFTIEAYIQTLADVDPLSLEAAALHLLSQPLEFMPTAGTIRHTAFDLSDGRETPTPGEAWEITRQALRAGAGYPTAGVYKTPEVHPLVETAVRHVGGWRHLATSENYTADRARFLEAYKQVRSMAHGAARMLPQVRDHVKALADRMSQTKRLEKPEED